MLSWRALLPAFYCHCGISVTFWRIGNLGLVIMKFQESILPAQLQNLNWHFAARIAGIMPIHFKVGSKDNTVIRIFFSISRAGPYNRPHLHPNIIKRLDKLLVSETRLFLNNYARSIFKRKINKQSKYLNNYSLDIYFSEFRKLAITLSIHNLDKPFAKT